jgi:formylglycine-generating enzyme required for sulfatase activity
VTNAQFREYIHDTNAPAPAFLNQSGFDDDLQPVVAVTWHEAVNFCRWLSEQTGQRFRLPTDCEWEYAARGGNESPRYAWGDALDPKLGCFGGAKAPARVGSFPPNRFGLNDMTGNVWDWCSDLYADVSGGLAPIQKIDNSNVADNRVLRGGSFMTTNLVTLWVAYRHEDPPDLRHESIGFRVAMDR